MRVNENILISSLTTMRLGGPARYVLEVESPGEVADAYGFAAQYHLPACVLGYGANTLGHDQGYPGVIIINRMHGITEEPLPDGGVRLKVMGGEYWDDVVQYACERGLTGIEMLSQIPGLACAAPVQNIGAYGQEVADTLVSAEAYDCATGTYGTLSHDDLEFGYRRSRLNTTERGRFFVISITLELHPGQMPRPLYNSVEDYIAEHDMNDFSPMGLRQIVNAIRAEKLPDPQYVASAGSFFKNVLLDRKGLQMAIDRGLPVIRTQDGGKISSGWLIEQAGFKGKLLHGMRVSSKNALVLINESAKSYNDLAQARDEIVAGVYDMFGYWLEQEPVELG